MKYTDRNKHEEIMDKFLDYLYSQTNRFIFKGGSALRKFYNLDRFSEDLDFDSEKGNMYNIVKNFCLQNNFQPPVERKDTNKGQRFFINYGIPGQTLKIETSLRNKNIDANTIKYFGKMCVYDLDVLATQKVDAFVTRDKIRDLYDVCFLINECLKQLSPITINRIKFCLELKGLAQYDYLIKNQSDEFIDNEELQDMVLNAFNKLGLLEK